MSHENTRKSALKESAATTRRDPLMGSPVQAPPPKQARIAEVTEDVVFVGGEAVGSGIAGAGEGGSGKGGEEGMEKGGEAAGHKGGRMQEETGSGKLRKSFDTLQIETKSRLRSWRRRIVESTFRTGYVWEALD